MWEGRFFVMKRAFLHTNETPPLFANNGFHSPLHSERGRGWGFSLFANNGLHSSLHSERGWGRGFPLFANNSIHSPLHSERGRGWGFSLFANNGFHSPLHSERGRGRGCRGAGGEAVVGLGVRLSFICKSNCFIYSLCLFNKNGGGK